MGFGPVHDRDRANIYHVASTKMELRDTAWCVTHSDQGSSTKSETKYATRSSTPQVLT